MNCREWVEVLVFGLWFMVYGFWFGVVLYLTINQKIKHQKIKHPTLLYTFT
jgi:hypothetical protein